MSSPNIIISGSGIAGSVFAHWLLRAYPDANITIVERAPALRLSGAAVDIRSSAVDIIKWMHVEPDIRRNGTNETGMQWVDTNGKPVATLRATGNSDMQSITSEYEILRGTLAEVFMRPLKDKVKLVFNEYINNYTQSDDGVAVTFAKSGEIGQYDLLVAADGLNSKIRGMLLSAKPSEHIHDEGVHVCYFTIKRDMLEIDRLAKGYSATGGRCVFLRPDPHPAGRTSCLLLVVTTNRDAQTKEKLNRAIREGNESYKRLMEEMFKDAGWILPDLLQSMHDSDDFYCSLFGQVRCPKLVDGRVVLLGDAGYSTPGFGTSLAIMGGHILAGELLDHPDKFETALKRYEEIILPFAMASQGGGSAMQWLVPQTEWGISVRNYVMSFALWIKLDRLAMNVGAWLGFSEKKLHIPEYKWVE